jgi:hypothetical protein
LQARIEYTDAVKELKVKRKKKKPLPTKNTVTGNIVFQKWGRDKLSQKNKS